MTPIVSELIEQARLAGRAFAEFGEHLIHPTVRLGVTGLSRSGKTVFITALLHGLLRGGRFPVFEPLATGRIAGARLEPQPDDAVPRFDYEGHVRALVIDREWPQSTRQISELRVVIGYQSASGFMRTLTLDIVDYPGEWLLDLPLLDKSYEQWSAETLALLRRMTRFPLPKPYLEHLAKIDPAAPADETAAIEAARLFTAYLQACRTEHRTLSMIAPGRFLMPGDLAGSPALTFAPLDRQIVLVDVLAALDAGPEAMHDLQQSMTAVLDCFRIGRGGWLNALFRPSTDRILFAATKADQLHHSAHDRLEAILKQMAQAAIGRAGNAGAEVDVIALAAVRATREALVRGEGGALPSIVGTAVPGEWGDGRHFDGATEMAFFPGDLPADAARGGDFHSIRFRPPALEESDDGIPALPHIRLDRALQFLIGDRLR